MPPFKQVSVLIVAPEFPYPPNHGGRRDVWGRIQVLKELGATIDLVATVKGEPGPEDWSKVRDAVRNLWLLPRTKDILDNLHLEPFQFRSRAELSRVHLSEIYDVAILEGDCLYPILENTNFRAGRVILRINNHESRYFRQLGAAAPLALKPFYFLESSKFALHNIKVNQDPHLHRWFASLDEYEQFVKTYPGLALNAEWVPPPMPSAVPRGPAERPRGTGVLFVGSLFMPNNREGIDWYLRYVHEKIQTPGYTLTIAGNPGDLNVDMLKERFERFENVRLILNPSDAELKNLYRDHAIFVNPMRHGAGITLKTIHAILAGLPVITTSVGCHGSGLRPGTDILVTDEPVTFAQCIERELSVREESWRRHEAALERVSHLYNHRLHLMKSLSRLLDHVLAPQPAGQ